MTAKWLSKLLGIQDICFWLEQIEERISKMATKQEIVDGVNALLDQVRTELGNFAQTMSASVDGIVADIADIKSRVGDDVDVSGLETRAQGLSAALGDFQTLSDRLAAVDAENPPEGGSDPLPPADPEPVPSDPSEDPGESGDLPSDQENSNF